jgi:hypothetical protein
MKIHMHVSFVELGNVDISQTNLLNVWACKTAKLQETSGSMGLSEAYHLQPIAARSVNRGRRWEPFKSRGWRAKGMI